MLCDRVAPASHVSRRALPSYSRNGSVLSSRRARSAEERTRDSPIRRHGIGGMHSKDDALERKEMNLQDATALALVGWYLIGPPVPHLNALDSHVDTAAPSSRWTVVRTFPSQEECETQRSNPWERCVASDDPLLILPAPGAGRGDRPGRSAPYGQP